MMRWHGAAVLLAIVLAGCAGPIGFDPPAALDRLIPGRSLQETVAARGLGTSDSGVTVSRLTGTDAATPLEIEPGDLWPDPVAAPSTLGPLADALHREGALPATPLAPAVVQPTPRDVPHAQPTPIP